MAELVVEPGMTVEVEVASRTVEVESPSWDFEASPTPAWSFEIATPQAVGATSPVQTDVEVFLVPGPPGPVGPTGPAGGAQQLFTFAVPSTLWRLEHVLGLRHVDVQTFDINDEEIFGDVKFYDGFVEVLWYHPTAGSARVST